MRVHGAKAVQNPVGYVFRAAANLATDHVRAERRRAFANEEALKIVLGEAGAPSPETCLRDAEQLARVQEALEALPPRTREIFALNRFDGISYRAIASQLGISTTAVEKHMARALAALAGLRELGY